jgi:hypothetical protein
VDNKSLTNRPDLWGHYGIAREFAALAGRELKPLDVADLSAYAQLPALDIKIENDDCLRYSGLKFDNVSVNISPMNMRIRLYYCGMRAINFLADMTNYLMLEMGQPMHAFDSRKVENIRIKKFSAPFTFQTLDEVERNIDENTHKLLVSLAEKRVISYVSRTVANVLRFTVNRQAEIRVPETSYTQRKSHYVDKLKAMVEYADNQQFCRSQLLLSYFGEHDATACGTCDVCRQINKQQRQ